MPVGRRVELGAELVRRQGIGRGDEAAFLVGQDSVVGLVIEAAAAGPKPGVGGKPFQTGVSGESTWDRDTKRARAMASSQTPHSPAEAAGLCSRPPAIAGRAAAPAMATLVSP